MRAERLRASGAGVVAIVIVIVILGGLRTAGAGDGAPAKAGVEARAAFARLKKLAGTWTAETRHSNEETKAKADEHKDPHGARPTVVFKLTGAGSALVETQFPGAPHEMVSIYHLDGQELRMTHYCAAGNQPRLKLDRAQSRPDHLVFVFDGGTNLDPRKDGHIHNLDITFHEDGRVTSTWEGYLGEKSAGATAFIMTRRDEKAGH